MTAAAATTTEAVTALCKERGISVDQSTLQPLRRSPTSTKEDADAGITTILGEEYRVSGVSFLHRAKTTAATGMVSTTIKEPALTATDEAVAATDVILAETDVALAETDCRHHHHQHL